MTEPVTLSKEFSDFLGECLPTLSQDLQNTNSTEAETAKAVMGFLAGAASMAALCGREDLAEDATKAMYVGVVDREGFAGFLREMLKVFAQ